MLQHLLSLIVLLNMLMSPVAVELQSQSNPTSDSPSSTMKHDMTIMDNCYCDCCNTRQCTNCLCGCSHLFQACLFTVVRLYQASFSTTEFPSVITNIINDTQPPELPPPLV